MEVPYEKLIGLNDIYSIWHWNDNLRVTFVSKGWLIVWDHRQRPPTRYDCRSNNHQEACTLAADKLAELTTG